MWTRELERHGFQRERRIRKSCIKEQTQVMRTESCWQLSLWLWLFLTPKSILFFAPFDIPITHNKMPSVKLVQVGFLSLATKRVIHVTLWVLTATFQSSLQMNRESFPFLDSGLHFDTWLQRDSGHVYTSLKKASSRAKSFAVFLQLRFPWCSRHLPCCLLFSLQPPSDTCSTGTNAVTGGCTVYIPRISRETWHSEVNSWPNWSKIHVNKIYCIYPLDFVAFLFS